MLSRFSLQTGRAFLRRFAPKNRKSRLDRSRNKRPEKRFTPWQGNQKTQRAMAALSGPSDLQTHVLQLKRGGRKKRGQGVRRLAGRPGRGRIARTSGQPDNATIPCSHRDIFVALVLLKRDALVRRGLLAATRSAATNAALHAAAANIGRGLRTMCRTAACGDGRPAKTWFAATQPDRNQADDTEPNWSPAREHGRKLQNSARHRLPSNNISLRQGDKSRKWDTSGP